MNPTANLSFRLLAQLFWSFLKIGPLTFGGGYAMLPMIEREAVFRRKWIDQTEMMQAAAVAGTAPGGIGVNAAAYIGYRLARLPGMAAAVAGMLLPAVAIILLLGVAYTHFYDNPIFAAAWRGIQVAVLALILHAAVRMAETALIDKFTLFIAAASFALLIIVGAHPIVLLLFGGAAGLAVNRVKKRMTRLKEARIHQSKERELSG